MNKPKWDVMRETRWALAKAYGPMSLGGLCWMMGIRPGRGNRYTKISSKRYAEVGRALQKMKRYGEVVLKRGDVPGWVLTRGRIV